MFLDSFGERLIFENSATHPRWSLATTVLFTALLYWWYHLDKRDRKLEMLAAANELKSLRIPPSNRLEKLKGDRAGQHSVRINDRWRICFIWKAGDAREVEIVDYH